MNLSAISLLCAPTVNLVAHTSPPSCLCLSPRCYLALAFDQLIAPPVLRWRQSARASHPAKLFFWTREEAAVFTARVLAYIQQNLLFISLSIRARSPATCLADKTPRHHPHPSFCGGLPFRATYARCDELGFYERCCDHQGPGKASTWSSCLPSADALLPVFARVPTPVSASIFNAVWLLVRRDLLAT